MEDKNRFKVLSTGQSTISSMTEEMRREMDLEKLEKRRDEIVGFNNDITTQIAQMKTDAAKITEEFNAKAKLFNENFAKLTEQYKVNLGALSENERLIDELRKEQGIADKVVSIDKNKKEK